MAVARRLRAFFFIVSALSLAIPALAAEKPRVQVDSYAINAELKNHAITTQLRAESYNFFNHPQFSAPNGSPTSANFGTITTQANRPRAFQFAVKIKF